MVGDLFEKQSTLATLPQGVADFQVASGEDDISREMDATSTTWLNSGHPSWQAPMFRRWEVWVPFETF